MATEMLHTYLQDHHAGAAAGVDLFHRVAENHEDPHISRVVAGLGDQSEEDMRTLEELMKLAGTGPALTKDLPARAAETLGRLKPNQRVAERSPLSDLMELEALTLAVTGKELGWKALISIGDPRLPRATLEVLTDRAREQGQQLEDLRLECTDALRQE